MLEILKFMSTQSANFCIGTAVFTILVLSAIISGLAQMVDSLTRRSNGQDPREDSKQ